MQRFKVSDEVEVIGLGSHGFYIGQNVRIVSDLSPDGFYNCNPMNGRSSYYVAESNLKLINSNNMELKITKGRILAAAAKCGTAESVLKTMFPEAFEKKPILNSSISVGVDKVTLRAEGLVVPIIDWSESNMGSLYINIVSYAYKIEGDRLIITPK